MFLNYAKRVAAKQVVLKLKLIKLVCGSTDGWLLRILWK